LFLTWAALVFAFLDGQICLILAVVSFILILIGSARPQLGLILYKAWNRFARYFAALCQAYVIAICYILIISPVGKVCSALRITAPGPSESLWVPRSSVHPRAYRSLYGAADEKVESIDSLWRSFVSWALRTDSLWACALLPLISLLGLLEAEQEVEVSSDIYSLF
jgi:hypothetical protein